MLILYCWVAGMPLVYLALWLYDTWYLSKYKRKFFEQEIEKINALPSIGWMAFAWPLQLGGGCLCLFMFSIYYFIQAIKYILNKVYIIFIAKFIYHKISSLPIQEKLAEKLTIYRTKCEEISNEEYLEQLQHKLEVLNEKELLASKDYDALIQLLLGNKIH
jgi:hypothetical protein